MEDKAPQTCDNDAFSPPSAAVLRELQDRAHAALSARRGQITHLEDEITKRLEAITSAISQQRAHENDELHQLAQARGEIDRIRRQTEEGRTALQQERTEHEAALEKRRKEHEARGAKQDERAKQLAELGCELESRQAALEEKSKDVSRREAELEERTHAVDSTRKQLAAEREQLALRESEWKVERETLELARDELLNKFAKLDSQQHGSRDEWQKQLAEFERKLHDQQSSWTQQRSEWDAARATVERDRDELKHKFELALEDVQRFRARVTELEQDLARRPETSQADSAELTALRAERDALAERVETLERQPVAPTDADSEQQIADLQRRFELAVEDVRELKTRNAELESRLSAAKRSGGSGSGSPDVGGMDWESQKRRMLASLEDEGDSEADEDRQKERASIENTIEMTDAVVAEKDREIEQLRTQLAESETAKPEAAELQRQQQIDELLNADEIIAEHRKRISQLEHEMEAKLRAAELEVSVERAKLAREKTELEELRIDLDARRTPHEAGSGGAPRRRWLSKLGLAGEEE